MHSFVFHVIWYLFVLAARFRHFYTVAFVTSTESVRSCICLIGYWIGFSLRILYCNLEPLRPGPDLWGAAQQQQWLLLFSVKPPVCCVFLKSWEYITQARSQIGRNRAILLKPALIPTVWYFWGGFSIYLLFYQSIFIFFIILITKCIHQNVCTLSPSSTCKMIVDILVRLITYKIDHISPILFRSSEVLLLPLSTKLSFPISAK